MLKPVVHNILLCLLIKYAAFYFLMMFINDNFYFVAPGIRNGADLIYYLLLFLFLPIVCMILFSAPLYFSLKQKKPSSFVLIVMGFLIAEYFVYTYYASQTNFVNGIYNGILSVLFLLLCFYRQIVWNFTTKTK
jgi:hypothetical protein